MDDSEILHIDQKVSSNHRGARRSFSSSRRERERKKLTETALAPFMPTGKGKLLKHAHQSTRSGATHESDLQVVTVSPF